MPITHSCGVDVWCGCVVWYAMKSEALVEGQALDGAAVRVDQCVELRLQLAHRQTVYLREHGNRRRQERQNLHASQ